MTVLATQFAYSQSNTSNTKDSFGDQSSRKETECYKQEGRPLANRKQRYMYSFLLRHYRSSTSSSDQIKSNLFAIG